MANDESKLARNSLDVHYKKKIIKQKYIGTKLQNKLKILCEKYLNGEKDFLTKFFNSNSIKVYLLFDI